MRRTWAFAVMAVISAAGLARAADTAADADALFRAGRRAADRGDYAVACAKFEASQAADPAPGTMLNLADCEESRGQLTHAWRHFLALADTLPDTDERKVVALERARRLERAMPKLRIRLSIRASGAEVHRDGVEVGAASLGVALPVDPGMHVVVVSEPGFRDRTYTVPVARGDEKDLEVDRGAEAPDAKRAAGFAMGGVGLASLAVGTATGIFALVDLSASNAACVGNVCANAEALMRYDRAQSLALATDVTLGVGLVLVVTSAILLLVAHAHHDTAPVSLALARF